MRCPKCGYLSFDHLEVCLKCNKNIQTISNNLYGSTYNIQAPTFLKYQQVKEEEPSESVDFSDELSFSEDDEYVDEDLEILVEEESGLAGEIDFAEDEQVDLELSAEDDQEDDSEIEIDFSQFEDESDPEVNFLDDGQGQQEEDIRFSSKIELPEELSDMSDLAHPARDIEEGEQPAVNKTALDSADLSLDDLDFDLGLDGLDGVESEQPSISERSEEDVLSLDEIDFSETLAERISDNSDTTETMSMDDLDFDLDLGGLSIHKEAQ